MVRVTKGSMKFYGESVEITQRFIRLYGVNGELVYEIKRTGNIMIEKDVFVKEESGEEE